MNRYRDDFYDDRETYPRRERLSRERFRREALGSYDEPYSSRDEFRNRPDYNPGRFGERAEYDYNEPRYNTSRDEYRDDLRRRNSLLDVRGDLSPRNSRSYYPEARSRLRCRDIMTRDLAVATRDTTLREVALMMKQEDTGVIPVVDYDLKAGNGKSTDRDPDSRTYSRGKLVGLMTDRDIVVRAVAEGKDCNASHAEEIMSTSIHTAKPNDRVVDVIRKMGDKQVRRIPVTNENGYLVGMISMADIAVETPEDQELGEALEEISKGSSFWSRLFS